MDAQDGFSSPEWRPASSTGGVSGGVPSTANSSIFYRRPLSVASPIGDHMIASSSDYSSFIAAFNVATPEDARNIEPFEAAACSMLAEEIRSFGLAGHESTGSLSKPAAFQAESLETAISRAAVVLRYNAKWFAPVPLASLLADVLTATSDSSSSAVFYAALEFLDTVLVYSTLPPNQCLYPTVRFLARTYYSASRANKTRRLGVRCWAVALHLLHSHLGQQFLWALHSTLSSEDSASKEGFGEVVGTLLLVKELLKSHEARLPDVNVTLLVLQLKVAARGGDSIVREHIQDVLMQMLSDGKPLKQLRQDAGWQDFLETMELCIADAPRDQPAQALVQGLTPYLPQVETIHQRKIATLFVQAGLPLTPEMSAELCSLWNPSKLGSRWPQALPSMLDTILRDKSYSKEVTSFAEAALMSFMTMEVEDDKASVVTTLSERIDQHETSDDARSAMAGALCQMFEHALVIAAPNDLTSMLFLALCNALRHSSEVGELLFRVRKDVKGELYLRVALYEPKFIEISTPLPLDNWFAAFTNIFKDGASNWDAYECVLKRLKILLGNHTMFIGDIDALKGLLGVLRGALETSSYMEPPTHTGLSKSHAAAEIVQSLIAIASHHRHLTKQEVLGLVSVFDATAGSRDYIVSTQCIHALTVCCYELPEVMSSHMDGVINKMSRMVTQRYLAIHVLHFLAGLSRLPDLHRNFNAADYKRIFGVCHSYLQSTRGSHTTLDRSQTPTSGRSSATRMEEALPEYVYALAHHVITFWYMSLQRHDREEVKPYITNCLIYKDADGGETIEDQGLVTLDMMDRIDAEPDATQWVFGDEENFESSASNMPDPFLAIDGQIRESHRLIGLLLVTTRLSLRTGKALVVIRRPSGTAWRLVEKGTAQVTVDSGDAASYIAIWPDDPGGHAYGLINIPKQASALGSDTIISLPQEDGVRRAIEAFDRTSALDSHKAGVIYIGERQTTEGRILRNGSGSPDYREFVKDLGTLQRLKDAKFNTQGLDRAENTDGEYTPVWHNKVTEMVFHVTTMMPDSDDDISNTGRKKRHIGNDHVNIVFNNSGGMLDFETLYNIFPGQLTYVYIVITPAARTSFLETRTITQQTDKRQRFYAVQVVTRPDYPNVSPAMDERTVSGASLPGFVRNLALNECIISLMWTPRNDSTEYPSSWRSRLLQLRRMGERYGGAGAGAGGSSSAGGGGGRRQK
ncbi:hypothetical protein D0860_05845 [Hortaea werneckii]|uniref:Rap-GAP domain-containing protein n=1 Tax=Hortaea werneckii TaxID=91943 RepID=A0A3M7GX12_HORWE|nr:hypothetical protein D0860_05845 [Hortaea werneckii]